MSGARERLKSRLELPHLLNHSCRSGAFRCGGGGGGTSRQRLEPERPVAVWWRLDSAQSFAVGGGAERGHEGAVEGRGGMLGGDAGGGEGGLPVDEAARAVQVCTTTQRRT